MRGTLATDRCDRARRRSAGTPPGRLERATGAWRRCRAAERRAPPAAPPRGAPHPLEGRSRQSDAGGQVIGVHEGLHQPDGDEVLGGDRAVLPRHAGRRTSRCHPAGGRCLARVGTASESSWPPAATAFAPSRIEVFASAATGAVTSPCVVAAQPVRPRPLAVVWGWTARNSTASSNWLTRWRVSPPAAMPRRADSCSLAARPLGGGDQRGDAASSTGERGTIRAAGGGERHAATPGRSSLERNTRWRTRRPWLPEPLPRWVLVRAEAVTTERQELCRPARWEELHPAERTHWNATARGPHLTADQVQLLDAGALPACVLHPAATTGERLCSPVDLVDLPDRDATDRRRPSDELGLAQLVRLHPLRGGHESALTERRRPSPRVFSNGIAHRLRSGALGGSPAGRNRQKTCP